MEYPENHRQIVEQLMSGKFILGREAHFDTLKDRKEFYDSFFIYSFGYQLVITHEYAYLLSEETDENLSRDICIFLAILCNELDKQGKNFLEKLQYSEFSFEEVDILFENSSYIDLIKGHKQLKDSESRRKILFTTMNKRNIIERAGDDKFFFTPAYKVFTQYAEELSDAASIKNANSTE